MDYYTRENRNDDCYINDVRVIYVWSKTWGERYYVQKLKSISVIENKWEFLAEYLNEKDIPEKYQHLIPKYIFEPVKERGERNCFVPYTDILLPCVP